MDGGDISVTIDAKVMELLKEKMWSHSDTVLSLVLWN